MRDLERLRNIEKNNEAFKALSLVSRRISELEAENDRLHTQLMNAIENTGRVEERCAGLREFAQDMMQFFEDGDYCTTCEKAEECNASEIYESDCLMHSVFKGRMRVLGVESK